MIDSNVLFLSFILQSLNTEEHTDKTLIVLQKALLECSMH